jgi:hypothetical protein
MEVETAINAPICALSLFRRTRPYLPQSPPLELIFILFRQLRRSCIVRWFPNDFIRFADRWLLVWKCVIKAFLNQADCKMRNVYSNPATIQFLSSGNSGSEPAQQIRTGV